MTKAGSQGDQWGLIQTELRQLWPQLSSHLDFRPRPKPGLRGRPRGYQLEHAAEAFLRVAYYRMPIRQPQGFPYPTPSPLVRIVCHWIDEGLWEDFWLAYVRCASNACLEAWWAALQPQAQAFQYRWGARQAAMRQHAYWFVMMRIAVLRERKRRGAD